MADSILHALQQVQSENALLKSQGLEPTGFGGLIEAGSLENIFGGDQIVPAPQEDLQQILTDQFDPRSVDPLGISGRATGQTGAESLRFGTPPPDLLPAPRSTQSREQVTRSLARLQTLDPTGVSAKFALGLIANRNAQDLSAAKLKMDEIFKETTNLLRIKDPAAQERQIIQTIRERASRGIASPALQKILNLPMERRVVGLEQRKTIATDVKTLADNEQKELDREQKELDREQKILDRESKERIAAEKLQATQAKTAKFENVLNEQGQVVAQRNTVTGELKKSPLATGTEGIKATFAKSPGVVVELEDGTFAQAIPVIDTRTGEVVNKLSPIPGRPVSRLGETGEALTARRIREAGEKALTKTQVTRLATDIDDAISAAKGMGVINRSIKLLDDLETGGFDAIRVRIKQVLGTESANEAELTANFGKQMLAQLRPIFGAQFTEREGATLARIEAGFGKSTKGNIRLLNQLKQLIQRAAKRGISAAVDTKDFRSAQDIQDLMEFTLQDVAPTTKEALGSPVEDVKKLSDADLLKGF